MSDYDDLADEAGDEALAELDGKLKPMAMTDLDSVKDLMHTPHDKEAIDKLKEESMKAKDAAERRTAYADFFKSVSDGGGKALEAALKITKKAVMVGLGAILAILFIAAPAHAQNDSLGQLGKFISGLSFGAGVALYPDASNPNTEAMIYWRGPQFGQNGISLIPDKHNKDAKPYIDFNMGGRWKKGEHAKAFPMVLLHLGNLMEPLGRKISGRWRLPVFPEKLVTGPAVRIPLPGDPDPWTFKNGIRFIVGWEF